MSLHRSSGGQQGGHAGWCPNSKSLLRHHDLQWGAFLRWHEWLACVQIFLVVIHIVVVNNTLVEGRVWRPPHLLNLTERNPVMNPKNIVIPNLTVNGDSCFAIYKIPNIIDCWNEWLNAFGRGCDLWKDWSGTLSETTGKCQPGPEYDPGMSLCINKQRYRAHGKQIGYYISVYPYICLAGVLPIFSIFTGIND